MSPRSHRHLVLVASFLVLSAACGSTVQSSSALRAEPEGATATPAASPDAPAADPPQGKRLDAATVSRVPTTNAGNGRTNRPAAGDVADLPGVTATAITVGVIAADPSTNQTMENAGLGAASVGNEPANWQATADDVNARGGIAGRRLTLVFYLVNLTESPQTQGQAACTKFTEDNTVAAVLSGYYYASAHACLASRAVPSLLGTNYGVDSSLARQTSTVVAWATPLLDRLAAFLPDAFQAIGKLKGGTTAGIFVTDAPAFRRSASQLGADLTKRGLKVVTQTVRDSDSGDYSGAATDASAAVLRFKSARVSEVLFLTHNAFEPTVLMQAASSQSYRPTYLLSTQQYPAALAGLVAADQLAGALAIGWAPAIDLNSGYDTSVQAQQCLRTLKARGRAFSSGTQTLAGLLACDGLDLLKRAAERPGALASRAALLRAALDSGTSFVSAVTFSTSFPSGRRDGVAAYRPMAYGSRCGCFIYSGPIAPM